MKEKSLSRRDFIKNSAGLYTGGFLFASSSSVNAESSDKTKNPVFHKNSNLGKLDLDIFKNPGTEYRGAPLWFFNDKIEIPEAIRQLRSMRYAGWGLVLLRKYTGLLHKPYEEKWNELVHAVLKECENLQMKVFMQESDVPFPGMKAEYGHKMLVRRTVGEKPHKNETLITRIGNYAYYNHLSYDPITSTAFRRLDTIHPEAVSKYVESLLGFLFDKFGYAFEKCVDAVWVDEPRCRNAAGMPKDSVAWTTILPGIFEKEWGYSLINNLPLLFDDTGDYQKVRHHYWRTVCNMFTQTYWRLMEETCGKHGVRFSGHQYGEDTFGRQMEFTINCMPHYEYMQRPGIDHLTGTLTWPRWDKDDGYPFILAPKQASSVAHQLGKKEVLAEMFGVSDQGTSFEDRKWIFEWLAVLGINYRVYHAAFYSLRGNRKRVYPMTLNYQQPWWKHNRFADDHAARLCYALRQGKYKADILLIHPIESFYMNPGLGKVSPDDTGQLNMDFANISHNLLKIQRSYDYGDESLMAKYGKVKEKMLAVGEIDYKIVILPSIKTIRKSTFKLLTDFLNNGGTVISVGDMPTMIDGEESELLTGFNRRITQIKNKAGDLRISLDKLTPPDIRVIPVNDKPADTIWVQEQYIDKGQMFFLTNTSKEETIKTEFHIRGTGKLESWNLVSGKTECIPQRKAGDYIAAKLDFTPTESHLLVFNETEKIVYVPEKIRDIVRNIPVDSFKIERKEKNALTLDFCRYRKGSGNWSEVIPVVGAAETLNNEKYRGPVSMQFEYAVEAVPAQCAVVIEKADEFSVMINGAEIRYEGLPYYRDRCFLPIDITQYVKPGKNSIILSRNFEPADPKILYDEKTFGTELEQIYLIGNFAVSGRKIGEDWFENTRHRYGTEFSITGESDISKGDLLTDGYCFFNGDLSLTGYPIMPKLKNNERAFLNLDELNATAANIKINNQTAGTLGWHPYRLDITNYVWEGENKIELALTNSLRNLLGALHYTPVLPGAWSFKFSGRGRDGRNWLEKRKDGTAKSWSDDYFFRPFGVKGVMITCERYS